MRILNAILWRSLNKSNFASLINAHINRLYRFPIAPISKCTMPNGGSDCCRTCWFNRKNKGEVGYAHADDPGGDFCIIRNIAIEAPYNTYCTNHPHHNPLKIDLPIGPVFTGGSSGHRGQLLPSPDSEEIRLKLISLLDTIEEQPQAEYPAGMYLDEMVVWQLKEFREPRAVPGLQRVTQFDPNKSVLGPLEIKRDRKKLLQMAREALNKINRG